MSEYKQDAENLAVRMQSPILLGRLLKEYAGVVPVQLTPEEEENPPAGTSLFDVSDEKFERLLGR